MGKEINWEDRKWKAILAMLNGVAASGKKINYYSVESMVDQAEILINYLKQKER